VPDAIVIGAGPNGLVGANLLCDRGWDVLVLEEQERPGGAVKTLELTEPGFRSDAFSAFFPLTVASPAMRTMDLEDHGVRWLRSPVVVAHTGSDGSCAALSLDLEQTCSSLDAFAPGDGDAWRRLYGLWERTGTHFIRALLSPFPPVRPAGRMIASLGGYRQGLRFARFSLQSVRRVAREEFRGEGGARLLAGNALHADVTPDTAGGGFFGWVLCGIGQQLGWPVPQGGAGAITDALVSRLAAGGGEVRCGARVEKVLVRGGRAHGVRLEGGEEIQARRAVLADVGAPALYEQLLEPALVPEDLREDLRRFEYDTGTVKVDWALERPIPWSAPDAARAGTVHVADGIDHLSEHAAEIVRGELPSRPFLLLGQYSHFDPTRAPAGKEAAWAYTHVPHGLEWDEGRGEEFADRMEEQVEVRAPGFRSLIRARHVFTPDRLESANRNLVGGALNGGTAQIHQTLVLRPTPGLGRPETPVRGLYLASAAAHPGGGVHGACGANAARAAIRWSALRR